MAFNYSNITISGGVGVGTSTLAGNLKNFLTPLGWQFKSTGAFIREHTKENIMPLATLVSDDFDREIEAKAKELLETEKKWVVEAWLAGWLARDMKHVLKVLVICSENIIRVDRVVNRDKVSVEDAKKFIHLRESENFAKWKRIYGEYNFFDQKYYDLIIDTYSTGQNESVGKVLDKLGYKIDKATNKII